MKRTLLTESALVKLQKEYDDLIQKRHQISEEIKRAREFGDLSENAEYHAAREAQSHNETEILKLKEILETYELVEESSDKEVVGINSKVKILYVDMDDSDWVHIVTKVESDPLENKISNESPIGEALIGHRVGDEVVAETPNGKLTLKIQEVE
ncbi:transcription elongation factor GreA [Fusibacter sp. JL298sf-3]